MVKILVNFQISVKICNFNRQKKCILGAKSFGA